MEMWLCSYVVVPLVVCVVKLIHSFNTKPVDKKKKEFL